jgi:NAD(P)-dependent dehydrogenase (short-subunit alcohol dehydrogenase family)
MGEPEEVAGLVAHLASAGADFIIGASLTIDGGYVA